MKSSRGFSSVIILLFFLSVAVGDTISLDKDAGKCVYTLYVKTGFHFSAGTDSKITITLGDKAGKSVSIPNLEEWGLMGPSHDYFEIGNLDVFSGRGPCIATPICSLNITSDGSGSNPSWYCDYIQVVSTGPHIKCSQSIFNVDQWLAVDTAGAYLLSILIDGCGTVDSRARKNGVPFVVGKAPHQHQELHFSPQDGSSASQ